MKYQEIKQALINKKRNDAYCSNHEEFIEIIEQLSRDNTVKPALILDFVSLMIEKHDRICKSEPDFLKIIETFVRRSLMPRIKKELLLDFGSQEIKKFINVSKNTSEFFERIQLINHFPFDRWQRNDLLKGYVSREMTNIDMGCNDNREFTCIITTISELPLDETLKTKLLEDIVRKNVEHFDCHKNTQEILKTIKSIHQLSFSDDLRMDFLKKLIKHAIKKLRIICENNNDFLLFISTINSLSFEETLTIELREDTLIKGVTQHFGFCFDNYEFLKLIRFISSLAFNENELKTTLLLDLINQGIVKHFEFFKNNREFFRLVNIITSSVCIEMQQKVDLLSHLLYQSIAEKFIHCKDNQDFLQVVEFIFIFSFESSLKRNLLTDFIKKGVKEHFAFCRTNEDFLHTLQRFNDFYLNQMIKIDLVMDFVSLIINKHTGYCQNSRDFLNTIDALSHLPFEETLKRDYLLANFIKRGIERCGFSSTENHVIEIMQAISQTVLIDEIKDELILDVVSQGKTMLINSCQNNQEFLKTINVISQASLPKPPLKERQIKLLIDFVSSGISERFGFCKNAQDFIQTFQFMSRSDLPNKLKNELLFNFTTEAIDKLSNSYESTRDFIKIITLISKADLHHPCVLHDLKTKLLQGIIYLEIKKRLTHSKNIHDFIEIFSTIADSSLPDEIKNELLLDFGIPSIKKLIEFCSNTEDFVALMTNISEQESLNTVSRINENKTKLLRELFKEVLQKDFHFCKNNHDLIQIIQAVSRLSVDDGLKNDLFLDFVRHSEKNLITFCQSNEDFMSVFKVFADESFKQSHLVHELKTKIMKDFLNRGIKEQFGFCKNNREFFQVVYMISPLIFFDKQQKADLLSHLLYQGIAKDFKYCENNQEFIQIIDFISVFYFETHLKRNLLTDFIKKGIEKHAAFCRTNEDFLHTLQLFNNFSLNQTIKIDLVIDFVSLSINKHMGYCENSRDFLNTTEVLNTLPFEEKLKANLLTNFIKRSIDRCGFSSHENHVIENIQAIGKTLLIDEIKEELILDFVNQATKKFFETKMADNIRFLAKLHSLINGESHFSEGRKEGILVTLTRKIKILEKILLANKKEENVSNAEVNLNKGLHINNSLSFFSNKSYSSYEMNEIKKWLALVGTPSDENDLTVKEEQIKNSLIFRVCQGNESIIYSSLIYFKKHSGTNSNNDADRFDNYILVKNYVCNEPQQWDMNIITSHDRTKLSVDFNNPYLMKKFDNLIKHCITYDFENVDEYCLFELLKQGENYILLDIIEKSNIHKPVFIFPMLEAEIPQNKAQYNNNYILTTPSEKKLSRLYFVSDGKLRFFEDFSEEFNEWLDQSTYPSFNECWQIDVSTAKALGFVNECINLNAENKKCKLYVMNELPVAEVLTEYENSYIYVINNYSNIPGFLYYISQNQARRIEVNFQKPDQSSFYERLKAEGVLLPIKQHYFTTFHLESLFLRLKAYAVGSANCMEGINHHLLKKEISAQNTYQHNATPSHVSGVRGYLKAKLRNIPEKDLSELALRYLFDAGAKGTLESEIENLEEYIPYHIKISYQEGILSLKDELVPDRQEAWELKMDPLSKRYCLSPRLEENLNKNVIEMNL